MLQYPYTSIVSLLSGALLSAALVGCPAGEVEPVAAGGAAAVVVHNGGVLTAPSAASAGAAAQAPHKPPQAPAPWHIPVGPTLPIERGKGLGPIRFGARLDTIERLIGEPCEDKTEEPSGEVVCRYSAQAVDFFLTKGEVTKIRIHRVGRPFKPGSKADYGIFNGRFVEGAGMGMLEQGVQEFLGKPKSVRKVEGENPFGTVEIHEYDGCTLEYDRLGPDRVILGGVVLTAPKPTKMPKKQAPKKH
jgi:hypothetical protein